MILEAAAKLPPSKARSLIAAAAANNEATDRDAFIRRATAAFEKVMGEALIDALKAPEETP